MSYNGSGVFNINTSGQPVVTGTVISSTAFNALTADLATGLTTALTKDGQTTPTANIPMGGFKITGIAAATTLGDALSYGRAATVSTLTNSALTSGRVPYASTAGLLTDSANLLYSGTDLTVYGLTVGRGAGAISTNTAVGASALATNTSGVSNTATGYQALNAVSTGNNNSAYGRNSLLLNTGSNNTGYGAYTLQANTSGAQNAAFGQSAGYGNTTGVENSFFGTSAGYTNSTGAYNTALGSNALYSNTTASNNVAVGYQAGYSSTTGTGRNVSVGAGSLYAATTAIDNVSIGYYAMNGVTTGSQNVAIGSGIYGLYVSAGGSLTTGNKNTFVGCAAGAYVSTGSSNTVLGAYNGNQGGLDIRTSSNYIVLSDGDGNPRVVVNGSGNVGIGATAPSTILEVSSATPVVTVTGTGTTASSQNFTNNGAAQRTTIGVERSTGGGLFVGSSAYAAVFGSAGASNCQFATNNNVRMSIDTSGIVTMSAYGVGTATFSASGVISSVSDETWKIKDGLPVNPDEMLKKLEPGYWYYNDEKKEIFGKDRQLGFYAQNVNAAIGPEAAPIPETYIVKDEDGNEKSVFKPWGYYDRSVLAITVMSLQKALNTIEELTAKVDALKSQLNQGA